MVAPGDGIGQSWLSGPEPRPPSLGEGLVLTWGGAGGRAELVGGVCSEEQVGSRPGLTPQAVTRSLVP